VIGQTYPHWEYIILDNASDDETAAIAARYAAEDGRIKVHTNPETVPVIENWNRSLRLISTQSTYCRVLHADDWMYPTCLEKTVDVALRHPSAAFIAALRLRGDVVQRRGLPLDQELFDGGDYGRLFMRQHDFWLSPTSCLLRSDCIRARDPFYPPQYLHADLAVYYDIMSENDFGFVHEVLSYSREHASSITSKLAAPKETLLRDWLSFLDQYGPRFFDSNELAEVKKSYLRYYYRKIVRGVGTLKGRGFVDFHLEGLRAAGCAPTSIDLAYATASEMAGALLHPGKLFRYLR